MGGEGGVGGGQSLISLLHYNQTIAWFIFIGVKIKLVQQIITHFLIDIQTACNKRISQNIQKIYLNKITTAKEYYSQLISFLE